MVGRSLAMAMMLGACDGGESKDVPTPGVPSDLPELPCTIIWDGAASDGSLVRSQQVDASGRIWIDGFDLGGSEEELFSTWDYTLSGDDVVGRVHSAYTEGVLSVVRTVTWDDDGLVLTAERDGGADGTVDASESRSHTKDAQGRLERTEMDVDGDGVGDVVAVYTWSEVEGLERMSRAVATANGAEVDTTHVDRKANGRVEHVVVETAGITEPTWEQWWRYEEGNLIEIEGYKPPPPGGRAERSYLYYQYVSEGAVHPDSIERWIDRDDDDEMDRNFAEQFSYVGCDDVTLDRAIGARYNEEHVLVALESISAL